MGTKKKTYLHMPDKGKKIGKKFGKHEVLSKVHTKKKISLCSHCINDYKGRWCGRRDLNPHTTKVTEPKSVESANSTTPACSDCKNQYVVIVYNLIQMYDSI